MNLIKNTNLRQIEIRIPYDIVSTKVEMLQVLFAEMEKHFDASRTYTTLLLNLEGCTMVDSAGLNFLVSVHKFMKEKNCECAIRTSNKNLLRTFTFSRLDRYFRIV
jgi:anti-anti-sigma factor